MLEHKLFWNEMNWVERRFQREENLSKGAPVVWQSLVSDIDNACQSLKEHYSGKADITFNQADGHRILVTVNRKAVPYDIQAYTATLNIQVVFKADENKIEVIIGYGKKPTSFPIRSDEKHAFIVYNNAEISTDELSRLILEETVFTVKEEINRHPDGPFVPDSWMR